MQASAAPNLTMAEAALRSQQVSDVRYKLAIDLTQKESFAGEEQIEFKWLGSKENLRVDFFQGEVQALLVNDQPATFTAGFEAIRIPASSFHAGLNHITVKYTHPYSSDGTGLTRFADPIDQRVYMHTQFEPYYANRVFPCFDQPDLKASYELSVRAPKEWAVISSTLETKKRDTADGFTVWTFPESQKFSTYLFSLHAGAYSVWQDNSTAIPLRLFARQSLAKYVDAKDWFHETKLGFQFYNTYFGFSYPFKKYDQVVAPEFNAGAMENVAAVTYSERTITRGKKSHAERRSLAGVILHEMAHMWFGDLVTMRWWNDLWLNESFAEYMSTVAMARNTEFKEAWVRFNDEKSGSMWEDQLVTTHPIEGPVNDALEALTAFDGITYGKGAATLQQLHHYLGEESFQNGVVAYFKKYAWQNTERKDFVGSLSAAAGVSLEDWQTQWLKTANFNTLKTTFSCEAGKIKSFSVEQTAPEKFQTIRPHAFSIALLNHRASKLVVSKELDVSVHFAKTEIAAAKGLPCPEAVYPNHKDFGYFGVSLDEVSLHSLLANVSVIEDPFLRKLVWATLWQMTRNAQLSFVEFGDMAAKAIATEKEETILSALLGQVVGGRYGSSILSFYYLANLENTAHFHSLVAKMEASTWKRLQTAPANTKKMWFDAWVNSSESASGLKKIAALLDGHLSVAGFKIDQDMRWSLIRHLALHGVNGVQAKISAERAVDPSFSGKLGSIYAEASLPNWDAKAKWIEEFKNPKSEHTFTEFRSAFWALFPPSQKALHLIYGDRFFSDLQLLSPQKDSEALGSFTALAPNSCLPGDSHSIDSFLASHKNLDPMVDKYLRETSDSNVHCEKVISLVTKSGMIK